MKLSFFLALLMLLCAQVMALMFDQAPLQAELFTATPLLDPASISSPLVMLVGLGVLLFFLFIAHIRREPGPLASGSFVTGLGHVGLQLIALEWLKPVVANPVVFSVGVFSAAAVIGSWVATRRRNEDDSMALIAYFISTVFAIAFGYFLVSRFGDLVASPQTLMIAGGLLGALPAYFSSKACATQIFLMQPGGGKALVKLLTVNAVGALWGGVIVESVIVFAGVSYATVLVGSFYLLAAWLFTQGRSVPFVGALIPSA